MNDGEDLIFDSDDSEAGELKRVSPLVRRLIADNGSAFTFTGTPGRRSTLQIKILHRLRIE